MYMPILSCIERRQHYSVHFSAVATGDFYAFEPVCTACRLLISVLHIIAIWTAYRLLNFFAFFASVFLASLLYTPQMKFAFLRDSMMCVIWVICFVTFECIHYSAVCNKGCKQHLSWTCFSRGHQKFSRVRPVCTACPFHSILYVV